MSKPVLVVSGDIHFSLGTLKEATAATLLAIDKANSLGVPFLANGDTHDSKASMRAECVNALISVFQSARMRPILNIGNHCKIHSKGSEHALNFMQPYAEVVDTPRYFPELNAWIIPYQDDSEDARRILGTLPSDVFVFLHQGLKTAGAGHYISDSSALDVTSVARFKRAVFSHYHAFYNAENVTMIGSPYSTSFGEADDPPKGFGVLYSDGSLEFIPTNLRRHIIWDIDAEYGWKGTDLLSKLNTGDLLWVKLRGSREQLSGMTKQKMAQKFDITCDFKLDLIPEDTSADKIEIPKNISANTQLDLLIDSISNTSDERKERLKRMWKEML